ncbi:hypothetical protein BDZ91DRAFT_738883 [Kalaharituber pfeilii]|nr:hypothetical protein BDZ91DRAFT_738883 [Kalaharituber pfeilii]
MSAAATHLHIQRIIILHSDDYQQGSCAVGVKGANIVVLHCEKRSTMKLPRRPRLYRQPRLSCLCRAERRRPYPYRQSSYRSPVP